MADYTNTGLTLFPSIVVDLYKLKSPYKKQQIIEVGSKWVKRMDHFGHPDRVRLVLETNSNYPKYFQGGIFFHISEQ